MLAQGSTVCIRRLNSGCRVRRHVHLMWPRLYSCVSGVNAVASNLLRLNATESWEFAHVTFALIRSKIGESRDFPGSKNETNPSKKECQEFSGESVLRLQTNIIRSIFSTKAPQEFHQFLPRRIYEKSNQKPVMSLRLVEETMEDAKSNKA